jgi:hypothetical protein
LPDPIPKCQTAKVETIIAQFPAICTVNFFFFSPQDKCDHPARRLASQGEMLACTVPLAQVKTLQIGRVSFQRTSPSPSA